jgi:hypothetical protein
MDRYETMEVRYEQFEQLDEQLYELRKRNWYPVLSRNFREEDDVFSELITFKVYDDA